MSYISRAITDLRLIVLGSVLPGKTCLPVGCLYSLRVWLRVNNVDHRLFGEDELWIGKNPSFDSIEGLSYAKLKDIIDNIQVYHAVVGKAVVSFIVKSVFPSFRKLMTAFRLMKLE